MSIPPSVRSLLRLGGLMALGAATLAGCGGGGGGGTPIDVGGATSGSGVAELSTTATTGAAEVRVVNSDGTPFTSAVTVSGQASSRQATSLTVTPDANGVVRIVALPAGVYTLTAGSTEFEFAVSAGNVTTRRLDRAAPSTVREDLGLLFVVNALAKTLSVVDTDSGVANNDVMTTGDAPNQVAFNGGVGYIVNSLSNTVQRFNPSAMTDLDAVSVGTGANPWNIAFHGGTKAYVTNNLTNAVAVLSLASPSGRAAPTVATTISVATAPQAVLAVAGKVFVASTNFSFDLETFTSTYGDGVVSIIDPATDQVESTVSLGENTNPQGLAQGADGNVYVVATGNYSTVGTRVFRINPSTGQLVGEPIALDGVGDVLAACGSIAVAANGRAFLNDGSNNKLHVIDTTDGSVVRTGGEALDTGVGPLGVTVSGNGRVWVFNFNEDTVSAYDAASLQAVFTGIAVGDGAQTGTTRQGGGPGMVALAAR
jgi:streptogramin lyase